MKTCRGRSGYSLSELLILVAIIGILASIVIPQIGGISSTVREEVGIDAMNLLNRGVLHQVQAVGTIDVAVSSGSDDELAVLALLKTRDTGVPGSPFIPSTFSGVGSSSTDSVRIIWTGHFFKLLPEGSAGTGIVVAE